MVLYYVEHLSFLSNMISIMANFHPQEPGLLLLQGYHIPAVDVEFFHRLKESGLFYDIISCRGEPKDNDIEYEEQVTNYYDNYLSEKKINLNEFSEIYLGFDTFNPFGVYLDIKNIHHNVIIYTCADWVYKVSNAVGGRPLKYVDFMRSHCALLGEGTYTKNRYMDKYIKKVEKPLEKDIFLDFNELWKNIRADYKDKIVACLDVEILSELKHNGSYLILPNSTGFTTPRTKLQVDRRCYIYQLLLDFYIDASDNADAKIFYKEHPQVNLNDGSKYFNNCTDLDCRVPSEFYIHINEFKIKNVVGVVSTAIDKLENFIENKICACEQFFKEFRLIYALYASLKISEIVSDEKTNYHSFAIDSDFLKDYSKQVFHKDYQWIGINRSILKGNIFTVIDKVESKDKSNIITALTNADKETVIVFINSNNSFPFYSFDREDLLDYIVPITIRKRQIKEHILCDLHSETIYVFCKDTEILEKISEFSFAKELKYTGIEISVSPLSQTELVLEFMKIRLSSAQSEIYRNQIKEKVWQSGDFTGISNEFIFAKLKQTGLYKITVRGYGYGAVGIYSYDICNGYNVFKADNFVYAADSQKKKLLLELKYCKIAPTQYILKAIWNNPHIGDKTNRLTITITPLNSIENGDYCELNPSNDVTNAEWFSVDDLVLNNAEQIITEQNKKIADLENKLNKMIDTFKNLGEKL